ncbi:hypothetical protein NEH83_36960 [Streptomyces sp. JUS-F4]|uniref:hypothetical protein n=1 Tax=Streptomyces TaxID=1883 RepID=UPI0015E165E5|nr:hypothetical protein [Streptomyces sp. JUS-F4]WKN12742.1 hypothetical protein NEH83_00090 [Streptomyces sp. JUS-F4]WKN19282.1 hypothetical protein NEH83_36960 [Streptomyces sp. JUS-F4]
MEAAQVAAELQELRPLLDRFDVAVEFVPGQVQGSEQVPPTDPVPLRMIRTSRLPSSSSISRTRTRSATQPG